MKNKKNDLTQEQLQQIQGGATSSSQSTSGQSSQQLGNYSQFGGASQTGNGTIECPAAEVDVVIDPQQKG